MQCFCVFFSLECSFCTSVLAHSHTQTISRVFIPLSMLAKAHAAIIWFEYVVCLWFYCCSRMIVLSFAKWHVDALLSLPLSLSRSRSCTASVYTHFHVIIANCVTIWLIVRHMMLFCCFDTLQTRSPYTMAKRMLDFILQTLSVILPTNWRYRSLRSEKRRNKNNST